MASSDTTVAEKYRAPLIFELIPVSAIPPRIRVVTPVPVEFTLRGVRPAMEFLGLGKRAVSILAHAIQLNLEGEEAIDRWMMEQHKTYYDWLRESLATRV